MMEGNLLKTFLKSRKSYKLLVEYPFSSSTNLEGGLEMWASLS